jgi:hypothetical protein
MTFNKSTYFFLAAVLLISGCKSTKEATGVWVNPEKKPEKPYTSMFVVTLTMDPEARVAVENKVAAIATSRGFRVVKSIDAINIDLKNPRLVTKEEVISKAKENNCEAIFVSAMRRKEETVKYSPEAVTYTPTTYFTFYGYYTNLEPVVLSSAYYSQDKTYYIETNLFDTNSEILMWSAKSNIFAPSTLESFTRAYTNTLMDQLKKEGIAKK